MKLKSISKDMQKKKKSHFNLRKKSNTSTLPEYCTSSLRIWCENKVIVLDYFIKRTPHLNGKVERINFTIMNKVNSGTKCGDMEQKLEYI